MFERLKVGGTDELVARHTEAPIVTIPMPQPLQAALKG